MAGGVTGIYARMLEKARRETLAAADQVPEARRLFQLAEGRATPLWLVGHLANTYNNIILQWMFESGSAMVGDLSRRFSPDFVGGIAPTNNPDDYPAWDEVMSLYDEAMKRVVEKVSALDDTMLGQPLPGELPARLRGFFTDHGVTLDQMISHDAYHRGQIVLLGKCS